MGFNGKTAVVTGAASGIGKALAFHCAKDGMNVVLADIEREPLYEVRSEIAAMGNNVIAFPLDVAKSDDVEALAIESYSKYGSVQMLFNNAGVGGVRGTLWESTEKDWQWVLGANLMGVVNGIRSFIPRMLEQNDECYVVNTSSLAGLSTYPGQGVYKASKHALVSVTETLFHEMKYLRSKVRVSVYCPGFVRTRIMDSDRNRPDDLKNDPNEEIRSSTGDIDMIIAMGVRNGMPPESAAEHVFNSMQKNLFYIYEPEKQPIVNSRMEDIVNLQEPRNPYSNIPG